MTATQLSPLEPPQATADARTLFVLLGVDDDRPTAEIIDRDLGGAHVVRTPNRTLHRCDVESIAQTVQSFDIHTIVLPSLNSSRALDSLRRSFRIPPAVSIRIERTLGDDSAGEDLGIAPSIRIPGVSSDSFIG